MQVAYFYPTLGSDLPAAFIRAERRKELDKDGFMAFKPLMSTSNLDVDRCSIAYVENGTELGKISDKHGVNHYIITEDDIEYWVYGVITYDDQA